MKTRALATSLVAVVVLGTFSGAACNFTKHKPKPSVRQPQENPDGTRNEQPRNSSFAWIRENVLPKCDGCHSEAESYASLMDAVDARSGMKWISPGAPQESAFWVRVAETSGPRRMPKGEDRLPETELNALQDWIKNGAPEN